MIRITVVRDDGEATQLHGHSGMAACMGSPLSAEVQKSDPPVVSFRCSSPEELAWNLAALMAGVRHIAPEAFEVAEELMQFVDFGRPNISHTLPPRPGARF